jgi:ElaB/YqjD/DUF883 family membrane-anchored ribosome-binding protein
MDANNLESTAAVSTTNATGPKSALHELGNRAADKLDESREPTARTLENASTFVHSGADQISDMGHSAADRLDATAEYVREADLQTILGDLRNLVRRYPAQILAGAAILVFLVARAVRRSDR